MSPHCSRTGEIQITAPRSGHDRLLGSIYLLIEGAGTWSLDAMIPRKTGAAKSPKG